jgi:hypothetical protein
MLKRVSAYGVLKFLGCIIAVLQAKTEPTGVLAIFCEKKRRSTSSKRNRAAAVASLVAGEGLYGMMDGVDGIPIVYVRYGLAEGSMSGKMMDFAMCISREFKSSV